jgi:acyl-CoA thioesterase-1
MARGRARTVGRATCVCVVSALISSAVWGQGNGQAPTPVMPAPFSRDCQVAAGSDPVGASSPLPNVSAALQQRKRIQILAIGASASAGRRSTRGGHTGEARKILQQAIKGLDVVMINRGVSGELAAQAAARIRTEIALSEPDLVLWQVGTNDALAYVPLDELEATVVETVQWLKEHKVDVVLVGLQYVSQMEQDDNYKAARELMRNIAAREKIMIIRYPEARKLLSQAAASGGGLFPDEFERSDAGYVCLAEYLARAITLGIFGGDMRPPVPPQPPAAPQPRN